MKAIHLAAWRRLACHAPYESPELSGRCGSSPIRKLAQCRQMYCVIYSCSLAGPSPGGGRGLASVLRRAPGRSVAPRRGVARPPADPAGPCSRSTKRLYRMPTVFSLGTGRTDFFLSSVHRLVSVCILRLCMHPVTSPVTACAGHSSRR